MQSLIQQILEKYPSARATTKFGGPHEIQTLFQELRARISELDCVKNNTNLIVKSSYGKGNWAAVPWLAILDSRETDTTQDGTYVVMLFREDGQGCHLKLAQGVTVLHKALGSGATEELKRRAAEIRSKLPEMKDSDFDFSGEPTLEAEGLLGKLYDASTIFSKYWPIDQIPEEQVIANDISSLVSSYEKYISDNLNDKLENEQLTERKNRIWAISAGENGSLWDECISESMIAIGWDNLGDLTAYSNQNEITKKLEELNGGVTKPTNDSLCCYQFCNEIKVGDVVVAKIGRKKLLGAGIVTSEYIFDDSREEFKSVRKVNWLKTEPSEFPGTGTTTKTLTEITFYPTFVEFVENYLGETTTIKSDIEEAVTADSYSIDDILEDGCFLNRDTLEQLISRLQVKKNIILQGPPGTGKTWLAKRLAYALMGQKDPQRLRAVQFHPNLSYEDFVRGWRPSGDGKLSLVDGAFMEAVEDARNTSRPYVVVIEEINRGNPAQIFGEMLTLLEADKRYPEEALELCYRKSSNERVYIPSNLYVIGTMNVADRSLALVDLALRRRFAFIDLEPNLNEAWRKWLVTRAGIALDDVKNIEERISQLNETIAADPTLGPQFRIGHSYVTPPLDGISGDAMEWFNQVIATEIRPLLDEYWFDAPERAQAAYQRLIQGM